MRCAKIVLAAAAMLVAACTPEHKPATKPAPILWHALKSWSGRGDMQTESFDIGYEPCRIRWETRNATSDATLRVVVKSAVSGRDLAVAVDHQGAGKDLAYINVDPHLAYLVIESSGLDWSVAVEESDEATAATNAHQ